MKRSVWKQIHTIRQEVIDGAGADCAIFAFNDTDPMAFAACVQGAATCVQEAAVAVNPSSLRATDQKLRQVILKCLNNLAVSGAKPMGILLTLLLPEETEESDLKALMSEAEAVCADCKIQIAGGHTTVSSAVNQPFAIVTGFGKLKKEKAVSMRNALPGHDIVLSKWIALEGTAMLAACGRDKLLARYPAYLPETVMGFEELLSIAPEAAVASAFGVSAMHDASEGGIFAALWELAEASGVGLTIDLKKLPIRQETVEVCEVMNANPYELMSGGCLIMTCEDGAGLVRELENAGIPGTVVGRITDSNDRLILNDDEVRYMDRPKQDAIYNTGEEQ